MAKSRLYEKVPSHSASMEVYKSLVNWSDQIHVTLFHLSSQVLRHF